MNCSYPVIVIPGIMAVNLRNEYSVEPETIWNPEKLGFSEYNISSLIAMHPDNMKYECIEPARVMPDQIFSMVYYEFIEELKEGLGKNDITPVFPFSYDWRHKLETIEDHLGKFIDEVIDRVKLMKSYRNNQDFMENPKVHLVGHSMGGVIIAGYLARKKKQAKVAKVATMGSPLRGSIESVLNLTTGTGRLAFLGIGERKRHVARLTPSLYYLLPSFKGCVFNDDSQTFENDMFGDQYWQKSIVEDIKKTVIKYGHNHGSALGRAKKLFKKLRDQAEKYRNLIENTKLLTDAGMSEDDWLCIVGINEKTRQRVRVKQIDGEYMLDLNNRDDTENKYGSKYLEEKIYTGDGTVPYLGAKSSFISKEKLVCVKDDDFDWEWIDSSTESLIGLHGSLPLMSLVQKLVISHFSGKKRKGIYGRPSPELTDPEKQWKPPINKLRLK
jgi:lecithin:cholesterol acyltransferase